MIKKLFITLVIIGFSGALIAQTQPAEGIPTDTILSAHSLLRLQSYFKHHKFLNDTILVVGGTGALLLLGQGVTNKVRAISKQNLLQQYYRNYVEASLGYELPKNTKFSFNEVMHEINYVPTEKHHPTFTEFQTGSTLRTLIPSEVKVPKPTKVSLKYYDPASTHIVTMPRVSNLSKTALVAVEKNKGVSLSGDLAGEIIEETVDKTPTSGTVSVVSHGVKNDVYDFYKMKSFYEKDLETFTKIATKRFLVGGILGALTIGYMLYDILSYSDNEGPSLDKIKENNKTATFNYDTEGMDPNDPDTYPALARVLKIDRGLRRVLIFTSVAYGAALEE